MPFAGGIMQRGYQCGVLWGAALAAGAAAYRELGPGPGARAAALSATRDLVDSFRDANGSVNCRDLARVDWRDERQVRRHLWTGGAIRCFRLVARSAPEVRQDIEIALSVDASEPVAEPVSCAAVVAERLGADERQCAMAAGFAGGIGLSGGACGALGAAIWMSALEAGRDADGEWEFESPKALALLERTLDHTEGRVECRAITGREFADVGDHAGFLAAGGCAELIDVLCRR